MNKNDLDSVFAKDGKDMTIDEIKTLAEAAQEKTRAVETDGKWACRKENGRRTITRADAVLQAEARDIVLTVLAKVEPLEKKVVELAEKAVQTVAKMQEQLDVMRESLTASNDTINRLALERDALKEQLAAIANVAVGTKSEAAETAAVKQAKTAAEGEDAASKE